MNKRTFSDLKTSAKQILSGSYWTSFAVCLLFGIFISLASNIVSWLIAAPLTFLTTLFLSVSASVEAAAETIDVLTPLIAMLYMFIALIPVYLFVQYPLYTGTVKHFLNTTNGNGRINDLFFAYKNHPGNVILISFLKSLYIFLWSLLFCIPGIIKTYQYSMIEFILAENPAINRKKAFHISKELTRGNKFRIFLFQFSFIGWFLLGALAFGIGVNFVYPYLYASMTQLYIDLRENALAEGRVSPEDFAY